MPPNIMKNSRSVYDRLKQNIGNLGKMNNHLFAFAITRSNSGKISNNVSCTISIRPRQQTSQGFFLGFSLIVDPADKVMIKYRNIVFMVDSEEFIAAFRDFYKKLKNNDFMSIREVIMIFTKLKNSTYNVESITKSPYDKNEIAKAKQKAEQMVMDHGGDKLLQNISERNSEIHELNERIRELAAANDADNSKLKEIANRINAYKECNLMRKENHEAESNFKSEVSKLKRLQMIIVDHRKYFY